jgi:3-methyladenine DNA glycosylase AlkD
MSTWAADAVDAARTALEPLADPGRAADMQAYMKDVAPFLGVPTPARRAALRAAWVNLPAPTSAELGQAARGLMGQPWRELHYAAADLIDRRLRHADDSFVEQHVTDLLTTTPWWDTVDALGSAAVSPLCRRADHLATMWDWNGSGDRWLVRASIQHQRGWKGDTDVELVLALCTPHTADREFFVAKAIGWALRDLAWIDRTAVERFLDAHPGLGTVATREARRGLEASTRSQRATND